MNAQLLELVEMLAMSRKNLNSAIADKTEAQKMVDKIMTPHIEKIKLLAAATDALEQKVRETALTEYEATLDKKPAPGIEIKEFTKLKYDRTLAFQWAIEHDVALIPAKLDEKTFERVAMTTRPDFVDVRHTPQVTIAKDLTTALTEAATTAAAVL